MKIGVFWRKFRNVEFQKKLTPDNVYDDAYGEAHQHYTAIKDAGFNSVLIEWKKDPRETYKTILRENVDLIFNASSMKEMAFLEAFNIPYVGSGLDLVATNKGVRKNIVAHHGLPTPKFIVATSPNDIPEINMEYPLFVKPIDGRGSAGISEENIIYNYKELPKIVAKITDGIGQAAIIEEFVEGRELTVGIIGYDKPEVLPLLEIEYNSALTNTYEHKMFDNEIIKCPMKLPKEVEKNIKEIGLKTYKVLEVKDYGRIDMILNKDNVPHFLEINTFAGLTMSTEEETSDVHLGYMGYMAKEKGYTRNEFIGKIVQSAIDRYDLNDIGKVLPIGL